MDPRPPDRLEALLTRAFDDEATDEERSELDLLAPRALESDARLLALAELRNAIRTSLAAPPVDVAEGVMEALDADAAWAPFGADLAHALGVPPEGVPALGDLSDAVMAEIEADAAWAAAGSTLRSDLVAAVRSPPIDIADLVMSSIDPDAELSACFDGELPPERTAVVAARLLRDPSARHQMAAFANVGEGLRSATHRGFAQPGSGVWAGVADAIGVERDVVHGWDAIATPLREAFAEIPPIDVSGAVMAAIEPPVVRMPRWASLGGPLLAFAMAAALLFAVLPMSRNASFPSDGAPQTASVSAAPDLRLAAINDAHVEELSAANDVVVQVMQFEANGPTFILVDDPGVPL